MGKGADMDSKNILFRKEGRIGFITLNRPEVYNALNRALLEELGEVIERIKADPEIGVAILTGAGEKAFASGFDINELSTFDTVSRWENSRTHQVVLNQLEQMGKPSIAAIRGYCLGGGLEVAIACTLRIASVGSKLGLPAVGLGIVPALGGTQRLIRLIGKGKAAEMLLTAKSIDVQEAFRIGLVNHVVAAEELMPKAGEMAQSIIKNEPFAVRLAMELIHQGIEMSLEDSLALEAAVSSICMGNPETALRLRAFLERKK
jgi:enoyl-CoA hydratase